jgi:hypothetical protein
MTRPSSKNANPLSQNAAAVARLMTKSSCGAQGGAVRIQGVVDPNHKGTSHTMSTLAKVSFIASLALIAALPASANMAPPEPETPAAAPADPAAAPADPAAAPADPAAAPADPATAPADPAASPDTPAEPATTTEATTTEPAPTEEATTAEAPAEGGGMSGGLIAAIIGGLVVVGGAGYWVMSRK